MSSATATSAHTAEPRPRGAAPRTAPSDHGRTAARAGSGEWPDAALVWSWTESVILTGYGPAASAFL
ncbi:hypothetical protein NMG29_11690 [Streptomyces cocklensis]|uniref:Uncharacterized protein n=1 Tax=Actinacidiphila cocklensis TaxID=887465 RepID=A0A9W4GWI0_9ACTN|nr:hypothetical protein [Actinacidiphila cocklensis]MDD1058866.1 hypothetical protein [Actinacidiphila cocklensis]WSX74935.1 hypothetical protein OH826_14190 [Streptomyces sp. NBC_00899]CAG6398998.1 conserved hypothetical protein [Actinacidiphila cocklensis]